MKIKFNDNIKKVIAVILASTTLGTMSGCVHKKEEKISFREPMVHKYYIDSETREMIGEDNPRYKELEEISNRAKETGEILPDCVYIYKRENDDFSKKK